MRIVGIVVALALTASCGGESIGKMVDRHRAAAQPVLDQIKALAPAVQKQPVVTATEWKLPAGVRLDFSPRGATYNAAIAFVEHVTALCDSEWKNWKAGDRGSDLFDPQVHQQEWMLDPACLLTKGKAWWNEEPSKDILEENLTQFERTKYILVLRLADLAKPGLVYKELEQGKMEHFEPGHVRGDAVLFEIATGTYLGASPST